MTQLGVRGLQAALVCISVLAMPVGAPAQTADEPAAAQAEEPRRQPNLKLDEITVTAQKRVEDVQEVPFSVTAVSGETLKMSNMQSMTELTALLPNATIASSASFSVIYVRGLGTAVNDGFEQSVGVYIDGVYMSRPSYLSDAVFDIERVELLRGPQGTLYGKNTVAGALNITTGDPAFEWFGNLDLQYTEGGGHRVRAVANGPIIDDKLAVRIGFLDERADGVVHNHTRDLSEFGQNRTGARIRFLFTPTPDLSIRFGGDYSMNDDRGTGFEVIAANNFLTQSISPQFDPEWEGQPDRNSYLDTPGYLDRDTYNFNLVADYDIGEYTISLVGGWSKFEEALLFDADLGPAPFLWWDNADTYSQYSAELRVTSPPGEFEFVGGLYFFGSHYDAYTEFVFFPDPAATERILGISGIPQFLDPLIDPLLPLLGGLLDPVLSTALSDRLFQLFDQKTITYSVFGQATWNPTEELALILGLRFHFERKKANIDQNYEKTGIVLQSLFEIEEYSLQQTRDETNVSPKVSLKYRFTPDIVGYATAAAGFKAGGFNPFAPDPGRSTFEQENSWTFEGGLKTTLFDERLTFNVGYFYTKFSDLQISVLTGIGTTFFVDNAASATTHGVEWETRFVPIEGGLMTFSGAWLSAYYDDFETGPCMAERNPAALLLDAVNDPGFCDLSGERLVRAPKWEISATYTQVIPLYWGIGLLAGFDMNYQSSHFTDIDLDPGTFQDGYVLLNARLGLVDTDYQRWVLVLNGKNMLDELVVGGATDAPLQGGTFFGILAPGRFYTLELRLTL